MPCTALVELWTNRNGRLTHVDAEVIDDTAELLQTLLALLGDLHLGAIHQVGEELRGGVEAAREAKQ